MTNYATKVTPPNTGNRSTAHGGAPPELSRDIYDLGVTLTGGSENLRLFQPTISDASGLDVNVADQAVHRVARREVVTPESPEHDAVRLGQSRSAPLLAHAQRAET